MNLVGAKISATICYERKFCKNPERKICKNSVGKICKNSEVLIGKKICKNSVGKICKNSEGLIGLIGKNSEPGKKSAKIM